MKLLANLARTLGLVGVFGLAFFDSSVLFALPGVNDFVLISFVATKASWVWAVLSVIAATSGSVLGAMVTYRLGQKGGSGLLYRKTPAKFREHLITWTKRFGALPVGIAAVMPPPCPYAPFVIAAGLTKVPRSRFGLSVAIGRGVRYSLEAALAMLLGKHLATHLNSIYWSTVKSVAAVALFALAVWVLYRNRGPRIEREFEAMRSSTPAEPPQNV